MMSDTIFKIFPRTSLALYTDAQINEAVQILRLYCEEEITFTNFNKISFIDCMEGLEHIYCPWCGTEINESWSIFMEKAYESSFDNLSFKTTCCNYATSLNELIYVKPCGFATFVIEVHNPKKIPSIVELHEMGCCFGSEHFFRMISAHY